jgi:hypothetical protein
MTMDIGLVPSKEDYSNSISNSISNSNSNGSSNNSSSDSNSNSNCCVACTMSEYVQIAIQTVSAVSFNMRIRNAILANNYKHYNNENVVREWEKMLLFTHIQDAPIPKICLNNSNKTQNGTLRSGKVGNLVFLLIKILV